MTKSSDARNPALIRVRMAAPLLMGLAVAGLGGCDQAPASAPSQAPPAVTVSAPIEREITEWDEYTGRFAPVEYVQIRAQVSGYLKTINFQDGQVVKRGDLLFEIDPRPFQNALATAQARLTQAQARLELAKRELARTAQLRERNFTPESTYDQRVQEARVAEADVAAAQAAIRSSELDIEFSRITAPVTGRVSRHEISVGNLVNGGNDGATLLTTIVSLDPIYFVFEMSESDFVSYQRAVSDGRLKSPREKGMRVYAKIVDEQDWSIAGRLNFVDNVIDSGSGTIRARAIFSNPELFLTPGQFGRLRLPGSEPYKAILVPDSAIVTDQSRKIVMVVKDDGTVEPRPIRPGPIHDGLRIVRSGLQPTDKIVINGLMRARPGAKVTPQMGTIEPDKTSG